MKITVFAAATACTILATQAFAGGNSDNAKAMAKNIKTYGGNLATAVKANGAFDQGKGQRGWGNAGSALTGNGTVAGLPETPDNYASGSQVSNFGGKK